MNKITKLQEVVDMETGEIIDSKSISYKETRQKEPNFIKLYIKDLGRLQGLSGGENEVLYSFIQLLDYENRITLNAYIKQDIASKANCSVKLVDKTISSCIKKGILARIARGVFLANPNLFGKGEWKDILKLVVTTTYDSTGRMIVTKRIEK